MIRRSILLLLLSACGPDQHPGEGDACSELFQLATTSDGHRLVCLLTTNRWVPTQWVRVDR